MTSTTKQRAADALVQAMQHTGVTTLFSLSGNQIMPIYDACIDNPVRILHTRHESAAVFMADAYAQLTGTVGVALVTAAPGFANALGALYSAHMAESPVILLCGDSPIGAGSKQAFQKFPQSEAVRPFVKSTIRVESAEELCDCWFRSVEIATSGVAGPVHIALPADVLNTEITSKSLTGPASTSKQVHESQGSENNLAADIRITKSLKQQYQQIKQATSPIIITGPLLNNTRSHQLDRLQNELQAPVIAMESPRGLNDPSLGACKSICRESDLVVLLGKSPDFTLAFANADVFPKSEFILIDADEYNLQHASENMTINISSTLALDPRVWITQMLDSNTVVSDIVTSERSKWINRVETQIGRMPKVTHAKDGEALHPSEIASAVSEKIESIAVLQKNEKNSVPDSHLTDIVTVCDGGEFGQWAQAFLRRSPRVINGTSGAIGGSIPYTVGASVARPKDVVLTTLGDGTAGFYMAELETLVREKIPAIVVIGNDTCWNAEYQIQLRDYGENRTLACEFPTTVQYDQVAAALGMHSANVSTLSDLQQSLDVAFDRAMTERRGTLINVIMQREAAPVINT